MTKDSTTVGMDLGDQTDRYCVLNEAGEVVGKGEVKCTKAALRKVFGSMERCLVAIEAGAQSPWASALLGSLGHEVLAGNTTAHYECEWKQGATDTATDPTRKTATSVKVDLPSHGSTSTAMRYMQS